MTRVLTKANIITTILITLCLPLYYKIRFVLEGVIGWREFVGVSVFVEFCFSALLGSGLVAIHSLARTSQLAHYFLVGIASAAAATLFTIFFYTVIFPYGASSSFLFDIIVLSLLTPLLLSGVRDRILLEDQMLIAEKQALQARYETLKSRLRPHFLFNSLSTLSDIVEEDTHLAIRFIDKMSLVYRYLLEHEDSASISLDEEVKAVEALLFVLETRHPGALQVTSILPEDSKQFRSVPLVLQTLVENALKHNKYSATSPLKMMIRIQRDENMLLVENSLNPRLDAPSLKTGLKTLSERLELLTGRTLTFGSSTEMFWVRVPLIFTEHS